MNWTNCRKPALLAFALCFLAEDSLSQAQKPKSNTVSKTASKNCGCDYYPMCDYTATKTFGQETYYGIKGSEKNGTYFNCKNGIVTIKWFTNEEYLADRKWEWRNDINDYGYVDYIGTESKINTKILYKFNLPVGGEWNEPTNEGDFANFYKIEGKAQKITVNGKQYNDVLKLSMVTKLKMTEQDYFDKMDTYSFVTKRYIFQNTIYHNGEVYKNSYNYYFDKYAGLIKEENTWEDIKAKAAGNKDLKAENTRHPLFKTITENLWMDPLMAKFAGFEKSGKYSFAWHEQGVVKQETGYWKINGNWIEISKSAEKAQWARLYEIVKSADNTIVLNKNSETFSPTELPPELRKD